MENITSAELQVIQKDGKIHINNYGYLYEGIKNMMSAYEQVDYTPELEDTGRKDVAALRKMVKALEEKRKEEKAKYLEPLNEFEGKVKTLTSLINDQIEKINTKLAEYEHKRIEEKKAAIRQIYEENIGEAKDYVQLDKIYNTRWENRTYKEKDIKEDICTVRDSTIMATETIKGMDSEAVPEALEIYRKKLSLTEAITYINKYEAQRQAIVKRELEKREAERQMAIKEEQALREAQHIEEEKAKREAERIREEQEAWRRRQQTEQDKINEAFMNAGQNGFCEIPDTRKEELFKSETSDGFRTVHRIEIHATESELKEIISFIKSKGIEVNYGRE